MHLHLRHDEYICVLQGHACIGLYDTRPASPSHRCHALIECRGESPAFVTFPSGVLHGWYFHEASVHIQAISNTFDKYGRDDNWGCYFGDPELGIPWPDPDPVLSDRARHFPRLGRLEATLAAFRAAQQRGDAPDGELLAYADTSVVNTGT